MTHEATLQLPIPDRRAAGRALGAMLRSYWRKPDTIVLALPRGGVPVAYEVAIALELPLDLMCVRKLGVPFHDELAMGAIASGGVRVLNPDVVSMHGIDEGTLAEVAKQELLELQRRESLYRGDHPWPILSEQQVIIVDDGLATGATMRAAVRAVLSHQPARVVIALPVAPDDMLNELSEEVDEVICPFKPEFFSAVGRWYVDFSPTTDREVIDLLQQAWQRRLQP